MMLIAGGVVVVSKTAHTLPVAAALPGHPVLAGGAGIMPAQLPAGTRL